MSSPVPPRWEVQVRQASGSAVSALVDGVLVEVRSDDAPLRSTPEAWATAFCLPAARAGAVLGLADPVDPAWRRGASENVALAAAWWGGDDRLPLPPEPPRARWPWLRGRARPRSSTELAPGRAVCFTGGVDSFFSLLVGEHRPTHLLYVIGFDVRLHETERAADVEQLVRSVAAATDLEAVIVRTDLLDHPRFASVSWEHTHGAAIAAIAHLLAPTIGTVVIPPSYAADRLVPWGSRPDLDPRWSVPGRTAIEHGDASCHRLDRVRAIAGSPLVAEHLRVCWANVGTDPNCGRCEKCVRTMATLHAVGFLDDVRTLPSSSELPTAIDQLAPITPGQRPMWGDLAAEDLAPEVAAALQRLLERSAPVPGDHRP